MKIPDKVRVGEKLSARWLNQLIDCLKELARAANMAGNGTSTSSIEYSGSDMRDTKYRGTGGTDLQEFRVVPFQLRLKPKHLCGVSADGNWPKIAQMKAGAILDYMGKTHPVPKGATIYDYTEGWVDLGTFSEALTKIYCTIKQNYKGEILSAEIKKTEEKFVPWGKTESNLKGDGVLSVFIGSYQLRKIEEVNRAHIYQAHCGTLDLQTIQVEKLFDADEEAKEEAESGSNVESDNYYTAPESEEYESKPAGLFRKRDEHLFIFKKLICGEGLRLTDGKNLRIKLRRANSVWPDGSGTQESLEEGEPVITLGGVEDIVFDKEISAPELDSGIIRIPLADTLEEITGAICGLEVSYAPAMLEDDGTVTFLGEDGSRLPQGAAAQAEGGSGSGSGDGPYINEIVEGVIYITIPIFVDAPSASASLSMSVSESEIASVSESDSASLSASQSESETESFSDSASDSASESLSASASASDSASGSASDSASESSSASVSASLEDSASDSVGGSGSTGGGSTGDSTQPGSAWEPDDESESDSASGSTSGSGSASAADSASGSIVDSGSEQSSSESSTPPGSSPSEGGSTAGSSPEESTPPGSSSAGGSSSSGSGGGSGESSDTPGSGCDCADKLKALEERIASLEARVAALEAEKESNSGSSVDSNPGSSSSGGCNCQCGDLLAQIQAAVAAEAQAIANSISYSVSVNGTAIATTEYGTLVADTTGSISGSGATVHSNIHY